MSSPVLPEPEDPSWCVSRYLRLLYLPPCPLQNQNNKFQASAVIITIIELALPENALGLRDSSFTIALDLHVQSFSLPMHQYPPSFQIRFRVTFRYSFSSSSLGLISLPSTLSWNIAFGWSLAMDLVNSFAKTFVDFFGIGGCWRCFGEEESRKWKVQVICGQKCVGVQELVNLASH